MTELITTLYSLLICQSKVPYPSMSEARKALREITKGRRIRNKRKATGKIEVYQCGVCRCYHHGHEGQRGKKNAHAAREEE